MSMEFPSPDMTPAQPSGLAGLAQSALAAGYRIFNRLIEPREALPEMERLYAKLLAAILLLFLIMGIVSTLAERRLGDRGFLQPQLAGSLFMIAVLLIAFSLSRGRRHRQVAWGIVGFLNILVYFQLYSYQTKGSQQPFGLMDVLLPLLLAAMLFTLRSVLLLWLANIAVGATLPLWYTIVPLPLLYSLWLLPLLFMSGLLLVTAWQRSLFDTRARELLAQATERRAEDYFHAVVDRALDMLVVLDAKGNFRYISPAIQEFLGFPLTPVALTHASDWLPPDQYAAAASFFQQLIQEPEAPHHTELSVRAHSGAWHVMEIRGQNLFNDRAVNGFVLHIRDITARVRAEQELKDALNQLQHLSGRLVDMQESEARRIAYELHDEVGQSLTALKLELQRAASLTGNGNIQNSLDIVQHVLNQIRDLSRDLHPPMLEDLGLESALRWFLDQQATRSGLNIQFRPELSGRLPHPLELACFRITQEATTNIIRHADAENVIVRLERQNSHVILRIIDDGAGFDVDSARQQSLRGESLGLFGMQQRVQLLGGELDIATEPGEGTTITARLPLTGPDGIDNSSEDVHYAPY